MSGLNMMYRAVGTDRLTDAAAVDLDGAAGPADQAGADPLVPDDPRR